MKMQQRKARIVTGKPFCDLSIGTIVLILDTDEEIEERTQLGESITVYTVPDDDDYGDAYYVSAEDIEIIKRRGH
jgi:hypothetical protein